MTPAQFKRARQTLGMSAVQMADALGLGASGRNTIHRIEAGSLITGPMALAVEMLLVRATNPGDQT